MKLKHIIIISALCSNAAYATQCEVSGFFKENCVNAGECAVSTIIWKAEYSCYNKHGICQANENGICEWQETPEFKQCVAYMDYKVLAADPFTD